MIRYVIASDPALSIQQVFAGLAVSDYATALPWYERLFGRRPDVIVQDDEAMWRVTDRGWIYLVGDAERAGRGALTLLIEDLDARISELTARGIVTTPVETVPGLFRKTVLIDRDGNRITLGEAHAPD